MFKNNLLILKPKNLVFDNNNTKDSIDLRIREKNTYYNKIIPKINENKNIYK